MPKYLDGAGLSRFWNNIQNQIGGASQEQVDSYLDRHPEATTTVQDGSITTNKLADGAVTTAKTADGAVTDAKLAQTGGILSRERPTFQGLFFFAGKEPVYNTADKTLTIYGGSPILVDSYAYNMDNSSSTEYVIDLTLGSEIDLSPSVLGKDYRILLFDVQSSTASTPVFATCAGAALKHAYNVIDKRRYVPMAQFNILHGIVDAPFNMKVDDVLVYASGQDVKAIQDGMIARLPFETYSGGYVKAADGAIGANASTGYTGYVDVSVLSGYVYSPIDHVATYQMAFYDENKVYVSGASYSPTSTMVWKIPIPANAKYARLSYYLDVLSTFYIEGAIKVADYIESQTYGKLQGKKLGIIGDSISTYAGYIPSGYAAFYPRNTVTDVERTWWKQLLNQTGMELCVNASWSGSTISGNTSRTDGYVGCSDARVNALTDGSGNVPDIIICWMGINDFGKSNGITCGDYDGTTAPSTATTITAITDAYGVLLKKLQTAYPNAQIFVCRILPEQFASEMSASYANGFPNINPSDNVSLPQLNESIEKIANAFGCGVIPMDKCGATFFNINTYTGDGLHPNALLTPKICEVAKQTLLKLVK